MPLSTSRRRNRPGIAAALLIVAIIAGCSSTTTGTPGSTDKGATNSAGSVPTAASGTPVVTNTTGAAAPDGSAGTIPAGLEEAPPMVSYFEPTNESFVSTIEFVGDGPFVMLNLFRLKDVPDFSNHPEMKPEIPMTTRELFYRYIADMDSNLDKVGAKRIFLADSGPLLIGPSGEHWDVVQMVQYPSKQSFIDLAILIRPELLKREVMLADSRIMPMQEKPLDDPYKVD
jgi:hypothetical protein